MATTRTGGWIRPFAAAAHLDMDVAELYRLVLDGKISTSHDEERRMLLSIDDLKRLPAASL